MTAERFRQIRNVFDAAMDQPEAGRAVWLVDACRGDEGLREEVDELLRQHRKGSGVLDTPAGGTVAEFASGARLEGRRLGAWEILREIGRGGMGVVYLARRADGAFQMQAAVKVLTAPFAGDEIRKRFRQEREILAQLSHPNIARLLDGGTTDDGLPYLVMELVDGQPLTDWCDERRASVGERLELLRELCQVVHYLHQNKVIHRDLKPANVLVDANGKLKLLDFGISKLLVPIGDGSILATRSGLHLLTPEYASPEQVTGAPITPQTDIYALGVIAYELLAGRRPFNLRSRAMHAVMRAICEDEPERPSTAVTQMADGSGVAPATVCRLRRSSPEQLSERLRDGLDGVVLKALRKAPGQRYRSAEELAQDLSAPGDGKAVAARQDSAAHRLLARAGRYRMWVVMVITAVLLIASGAATIRAQAILYALGAAAVLGIWYAVTDLELNQQLANALSTWRGTALFALVVLAAVVATFRLASSHLPNFQAALAALFAAGTIFYSGMITRWLFRERWAGILLCTAGIKLPRWYRWLNWSGIVLSLCILVFAIYFHSDIALYVIVQVVLSLANSLQTRLMAGKIELRQRGIIGNWLFLPWDQIEAWNWDKEGTAYTGSRQAALLRGNAVLRIVRRKAGQRQPPIPIPISPLKMDEVSSVMQRFLGDWPGLAGAPEGHSMTGVNLAPKRLIYFALAAIALCAIAICTDSYKTQIDQILTQSRTTFWQVPNAVSRNAIDGLLYAWIPAGSFTMGCSPGDQRCAPNEKPAHEVNLRQGFWIGTTQVTVGAFNRFGKSRGRPGKGPAEDSDFPVVVVDWSEARAYCEWVGMRLPTEAEWEYAARAQTAGPAYGNLQDIAWMNSNGRPQNLDYARHTVAGKQPNAWGLYDVIGNMREWTADRYKPAYDSQAAEFGRAVRGGSARVSNRSGWEPHVKDDRGSFRCAGELH